jgi:hypothetical protein
MTADILQREGLEPMNYASSDRMIINYESGIIWKEDINWTYNTCFCFPPQFF